MRDKTATGIVILERYPNLPPNTLFFTQLLAHSGEPKGENVLEQGAEKASHNADASAGGAARYRQLGAEPQSLPKEPALVRIRA